MRYKGSVSVVCQVEVEANATAEARELLERMDAYELIGGVLAENVDRTEVLTVQSAGQEQAQAAHLTATLAHDAGVDASEHLWAGHFDATEEELLRYITLDEGDDEEDLV